MKRILIDLRLTWNVVWRYVLSTNQLYVTVGLFIVTLLALQWLFNIDELRYIIFDNTSLSLMQKFNYFTEAFFNIFQYASAFTPIAMIIIASLQAAAISLLLILWRLNQRTRTHSADQLGSLLLGVVGAGCIACGGSLLTPILSAIAGSLSLGLAENLGSIVLLVAIISSYLSLSKIAFRTANETHRIEV